MNRLHLEIWQEVFTHACIDGGYTAASLALVCKFFYHASLPVRFHSLSFFSLQQVELFLAFAGKWVDEGCRARPCVHHLLLCFSHSAFSDSTPEPCTDGPPDAHHKDVDSWITARRLREEDKAAWDHKFLEVVPALFDLVATDLRTLALLQSDGFTWPPIRNSLPGLRELTLLVGISAMLNQAVGVDQSGRSAGSALHESARNLMVPAPGTAPSPCTRFPSLERLHVVCGRHRDFRLRDTLAHLPHVAPRLTHLRISNATYTHAQCIPTFLRAALGIPVPQFERMGVAAPPKSVQQAPDSDPDVPAALPALRRVVVHSVLPPDGGTCDNAYREYVAFMENVNAISAACDVTGTVRVRSLRSDREKHQRWEELVNRHWMERIEGGQGCWMDCEAP
ncbi:hypothetical protein BD414DRAFT_221509 [Trametes punicea]|nr:hypothetical protein BD414DRAFT_221509 [Trametes punicea]